MYLESSTLRACGMCSSCAWRVQHFTCCLWRCRLARPWKKDDLCFISRTCLISSYHVKSFIQPIRKSSRRAASMRPTQNVEPHQACTATSYNIPQQRGATRRVPITRMMTNTSAARATRCARSVRTPPDRRRPRGSMQAAACHYQARARGPARPH